MKKYHVFRLMDSFENGLYFVPEEDYEEAVKEYLKNTWGIEYKYLGLFEFDDKFLQQLTPGDKEGWYEW